MPPIQDRRRVAVTRRGRRSRTRRCGDSRPLIADLFRRSSATMLRIDTHHHAIPSFYRDLLLKTGIDEAGGRALPEWSPEGSLQTMSELDVASAILSVSTPGTAFLPSTADAASLARDINDYLADLMKAHPDRFGFFAT